MVDVAGILIRLGPIIEKKVRQEIDLVTNAAIEAGKLASNLKEIQKLLEEAEKRRVADHRIRSWIERLEDVTYEIDDALDDWETENREPYEESPSTDKIWTEKVRSFVGTLNICASKTVKLRGIALTINGLNGKVDEIAQEDSVKFGLLSVKNDLGEDMKREKATSFNEIAELNDQTERKGDIVEMLLTPGMGKGDFQIISLVGMAGIGKTVLAHLAFRDERVKSCFQMRIWISVSNVFDEIWMAKAILESFGQNFPVVSSQFEILLQQIQSCVEGKKLLLVLDDLWMDKDNAWNQIKDALRSAADGSRILVTTRHTNMPRLMGSSRILTVGSLSDSDCWSLFSWIAFRGMQEKYVERRRIIGKKIADKCKGLPSAARTLGNYLHSRHDIELWKWMLEKETWELEEEMAKTLFAPIALEYSGLPLPVKRCFSCCAIFPKGFEIDVDELVRIWMVQGYLGALESETESKGREYFEILATRSFFQDLREDEFGERYISCKMHDIVLDFAQFLTKSGSPSKELRSFVDSNDHPPTLPIDKLKPLRILILKCKEMQELTSDIGNFIHLRSLVLHCNSIQKLPDTVCDLCNLLTLDLRDCQGLCELPRAIHKWRKLRHLLLEGTENLGELPQGFNKLTDLRLLDQFKIGSGRSKVGCLKELNMLQGTLRIDLWDMKEEIDVQEADMAEFRRKKCLEDLDLWFHGNVRMDVMEAMEAPESLKSLRIHGYKGSRFPSWIVTSLKMLRVLVLENCENCSRLPPLGFLPSLEDLHIVDFASLKYVTRAFYGIFEGNDLENDPSDVCDIFPNLKNLEISQCRSWKEWEDISIQIGRTVPSIMPRLQILRLTNCSALTRLPHRLLCKLSSVQSLEIRNCILLEERYNSSDICGELIDPWRSKVSFLSIFT